MALPNSGKIGLPGRYHVAGDLTAQGFWERAGFEEPLGKFVACGAAPSGHWGRNCGHTAGDGAGGGWCAPGRPAPEVAGQGSVEPWPWQPTPAPSGERDLRPWRSRLANRWDSEECERVPDGNEGTLAVLVLVATPADGAGAAWPTAALAGSGLNGKLVRGGATNGKPRMVLATGGAGCLAHQTQGADTC